MPIIEQDPEEGYIVIDDYYTCQCSWMGHTLRVELMKWSVTEEPQIEFEFRLNPTHGFCRRVKEAFKYIFKMKNCAPQFDVFALRPNEVDRLISILTKYKVLRKCYDIARERASNVEKE